MRTVMRIERCYNVRLEQDTGLHWKVCRCSGLQVTPTFYIAAKMIACQGVLSAKRFVHN